MNVFIRLLKVFRMTFFNCDFLIDSWWKERGWCFKISYVKPILYSVLNIFSCIKAFNSNTAFELLMIAKSWCWHWFLEFPWIFAGGFDIFFSNDCLRNMGEAEFWESRMNWPLKRSSLWGEKYNCWESVLTRKFSSNDCLVRGRRELAVITNMLISLARKNSL